MHNKLRILCIYGYIPENKRHTDSRVELLEHDVVVVDSYDEAQRVLKASKVTPPFDAVLSDFQLFKDRSGSDLPCLSPLFLLTLLEQKLVGGLGIFVPDWSEYTFESSNGYTVVVASKDCWTFYDSRNWERLLGMVIKASEEAHEFSARHRS